jgi:hypothetical protein
MTSSELFQSLSEKLPTVEYLFFQWSGGGDDWTGYEFIKGKNETGEFTEFPLSTDTDIQKEMKSFVLFDEMNMDMYCVDQGSSEGVLLIALKPLTESFDEDSLLYVDAGFKGFAIGGINHIETFGSLEV